MNYYLRIEGVNLDNFVYDTNDLNTIRGGGLLLLDAIEYVGDILLKILGHKPETITQGASWGLFQFSADSDNQAADIADTVLQELKDDRNYKHTTFVANLLPNKNSYSNVLDSLHALNRWQQMHIPSLVLPRPETNICEFDKIRPASDTEFEEGQNKYISYSVKQRRQYGQGQKREKFYTKRTGINNLQFTNHFSSLSDNQTIETMDCKMAVIYLDGNDFGKQIRAAATSPNKQKRIDKNLRKQQNTFLKKLVRKANKNKSGDWKFNDELIQLETLLWGGDEMLFVVPAWHGWEVLKLFYSNKFTINGQEVKHAGGLVFCHHKAPIHRVKQLACNLADLAKKYKEKNCFAYQVLESFDHAGMDLDSYRERHSAGFIYDRDQLLISAEDQKMAKIEELFTHIKSQKYPDFPRRKLQQIVHSIRHNPAKCQEYIEALCQESESIRQALQQLVQHFSPASDVMWLHLIELWDYVGKMEENT